MQESKDASFFTKMARDEQKINKGYKNVRKWEIAPKTFAATELSQEEFTQAQESARQAKSNAKRNRASDSGDHRNFNSLSPKSGPRGDILRASIPKFANSPSGANFSERKWNDPNSPSKHHFGGSQAGDSLEPKSPFTGAMSGTRGSL